MFANLVHVRHCKTVLYKSIALLDLLHNANSIRILHEMRIFDTLYYRLYRLKGLRGPLVFRRENIMLKTIVYSLTIRQMHVTTSNKISEHGSNGKLMKL